MKFHIRPEDVNCNIPEKHITCIGCGRNSYKLKGAKDIVFIQDNFYPVNFDNEIDTEFLCLKCSIKQCLYGCYLGHVF
jgi:hypothetical protein